MEGRARARANIALIKYWGKRSGGLNLPAVGSISITLDQLWTDTRVSFPEGLARDEFLLDGEPNGGMSERVFRNLDLLRERAAVAAPARVESSNNFPTGAGLASSASAFAALVGAGDRALGLDLSPRELSVFARRGSGSAARSVFGGYVEMHRGEEADGSDSYAEPLLEPDGWPLEVVIAITARGSKSVGSTEGMSLSAASPYFTPWVESSPADLAAARAAITKKDFEALGRVSEHSCLKMHALAMATEPALLYWLGATVDCMRAVVDLRRAGTPVFFTVDAGPQVKAICEPSAAGSVRARFEEIPGVREVLSTGLGPGVQAA